MQFESAGVIRILWQEHGKGIPLSVGRLWPTERAHRASVGPKCAYKPLHYPHPLWIGGILHRRLSGCRHSAWQTAARRKKMSACVCVVERVREWAA